ncbi:MAG TPA: hypothetical protein DGT23_29575 [Micromonosporaceae bacterium]|nr:hypothetical protein [Micromonosporaceae bacterium]
MLSDAEQRRLTEIETQLQADDPVFVQRFSDEGQGGLRPAWWRLVAVLTATIAVLVCGAGLALGNVATVVIAMTTAGAAAGLWITHRRRF